MARSSDSCVGIELIAIALDCAPIHTYIPDPIDTVMAGASTSSLRDIVEAVSSQLREHDVIIDSNRRAVVVLEEDNVRLARSSPINELYVMYAPAWLRRLSIALAGVANLSVKQPWVQRCNFCAFIAHCLIASSLVRMSQETLRTVLHNQDASLQARLTGETDAMKAAIMKRVEGQGAEIGKLRDQAASVDRQLDRIMSLLERLSSRLAAVEYEVGLGSAKPPSASSTTRSSNVASPASRGSTRASPASGQKRPGASYMTARH